jgi:hypothetical protein
MADRSNSIKKTPPNLTYEPRIEFRKRNFDGAVWLKGYWVIIEKAVRCPCEGQMKNALSSCTNCYGNGFFFINPITTRALITSINKDTKYKEWSPEIIGNISITVKDDLEENLSFYDKITFYEKYGFHAEVLRIREDTVSQQNFIFLVYRPEEILDVWIFNGSENPLIKLNESEYVISTDNPYILLIDIASPPTNFNNVVSVRYRHQVQYNVIDIPHEIRASNVYNDLGQLVKIDLPVNAIMRRSHLLLAERPNYDGTGLQDNSYE